MTKMGTELVLLGIVGLYSFYSFSSGYMLGTSIVAIVAFLMTKSLKAVLGTFIGAILLRMLNDLLKPKVVHTMVPATLVPEGYDLKEGFQPKNPISIHQRITSNKGGAPLNPKVDVITGVLESPKILDSLQVSDVLPSEQGASMKTLPSSMKASEPIQTPSESNPPNSSEREPYPNVHLQNGPDSMGVATALATKGTGLFAGQPAADVAGTKLGPSAV
jgi:hypothetical protein